MGAKIIKLPEIADPTIDQVFEEFLAEQGERLKPKTHALYETVIDLLKDHLNGYAYEGLSKAEGALFDKYFNAEGKEHREFCELFGPEEVLPNLGMFLSFFMVRKVICGEEIMRGAGTVTKKLSKWLAEKGHVSVESAREGAEKAAEAARDLPNAERAAKILYHATADLEVDSDNLKDEDFLDFDHFTITRIEPGKLWLESFLEGGAVGPISVPKEATDLLRIDWDISCALVRVRGKWGIIEMANVYPL